MSKKLKFKVGDRICVIGTSKEGAIYAISEDGKYCTVRWDYSGEITAVLKNNLKVLRSTNKLLIPKCRYGKLMR